MISDCQALQLSFDLPLPTDRALSPPPLMSHDDRIVREDDKIHFHPLLPKPNKYKP